jgi:hypothetical protein
VHLRKNGLGVGILHAHPFLVVAVNLLVSYFRNIDVEGLIDDGLKLYWLRDLRNQAEFIAEDIFAPHLFPLCCTRMVSFRRYVHENPKEVLLLT